MRGPKIKVPETLRGVYERSKPICINGRVVGELYYTDEHGSYGYLCYATDNGASGYYDFELKDAIAACKKDHREHIKVLKNRIKSLTKELEELLS